MAFIGRQQELNELFAALDALQAGSGAFHLLAGEPGIGKTRLAEQLAIRAARSGSRVLWGRCWEVEGRPPYWPWVQVIRDLVGEFRSEALASMLGPRLPRLMQIVPELRTVATAGTLLEPSESEAARFHLFDATATFLAQSAAKAPIVLILDDVHWADVPSLRLLEFVVRTVTDKPMLVLATYRHVEAHRDAVVGEILGSLARIGRTLALIGFSEGEVGLLIEQTAGRTAPDALVRAIHRHTEGNPFFVDEVVRNLCSAARGSEWPRLVEALPVPHGVRGAIRERVAPLGADTRRVLGAAAVIGRDFELELLAAVCDRDATALMPLLAPALELAILARPHGASGRYRFTHALVREALYEELSEVERSSIHLELAEIVERRSSEHLEPCLAELAHHFFEAAAGGGSAKAIQYAVRAGRQAMNMLAYEEAAEQFGRALQLLTTRTDAGGLRQRCEVLVALGEAHDRGGRVEAATDAFRRAATLARQIGEAELLAHAAIGLCAGTGLFWTEFGRSDDGLVRILTEALAALKPEAVALRARVMTRIATEMCWTTDVARAASLSRDSIALARSASDPATLAYALLGRILCVSGPDHIEERATIASEILELTEITGDREVVVNALMWRVGDALQLGDLEAVRAARARLFQRVTELRQPADLWMLAAIESQTALMEGRYAAAAALAGEIVAEPTRHANAGQMASALLFLVRRDQGGLADLETTLRGLVSQYPAVAVWRASLGFLHAEIGRPADAVADCATLLGKGFAALPRDVAWLYTVSCLSEVCAQGGSSADAESIYAALQPYESRHVVAGPIYYLAPVSYYLGRLSHRPGSLDRAIRHYEDALVRCAALGAQPCTARILVTAAEARIARSEAGDRDVASELLDRALAIAQLIGMEPLLGRIRELHEALGGVAPRSRERARDPRRSVFRREGDVWTVVHDGRTSRLRDARGFRYLTRLFAEPSREFHALDLVRVIDDERAARPRRASARPGVRAGVSVETSGSAEALLDARAKRALRDRLAELRAELDRAERCNDLQRAADARSELEALAEQLAGAVGLGGRDRRARAASEAARVAVTKAIRSAIERIRENDPSLGRLLATSVHTGIYCSYQPVDELRIEWEL